MDNRENHYAIEQHGPLDNKSLLQFVSRIRHNWYWFIISVGFSVAVAFFYLRYQTPVYEIDAKILVKDEKQGGGLSSQGDLIDLNNMLGGISSIDNEAMILKTRYLMEQVVRELHSNITYFKKGRMRDVELYNSPFILNPLNIKDSIRAFSFSIRSLENNKLELSNDDFRKIVTIGRPFILDNVGKVKIDRNPGIFFGNDEYKCNVTSVDSKVASFMGSLKVAVSNKQVSIADLTFSYSIPQKGEDILNTLITKYVQANLNDRNLIADSTIAFIENRLVYVGQELGSIEGDIQHFRQSQRITDIDAQSKLLIENSSQYVEELAKIETQLSVLKSIESYLKDNPKNTRVLPSSILPQDEVFSGLIDRYNSLLLERDRMSLSSTDTNPYIQNLDQQIANFRKDMLSNLVSTRSSLQISRSELLRRTGQVEGEIRKVPSSQRTYLDMARQQQIKQELYVFLLQKREETAISKTSNISNSKVIDPPKANPNPISPKRRTVLFLSLVIGLCIPLVVAYLKELLNVRIRTKEDVLNATSVPVIGEISNNNSSETIVVSKDARSPIAEQFRALRTNLSFFLKDSEKTILLTSSMSGEGKSFIALNIASVLALSGKRVVVMEMDLRKPNLSNKLGINNNFGFSNYIVSDDLKPEDVVIPSGIQDNLFIISSGPLPPNPAETILDNGMSVLMKYLKANFDYIIIDAPPIGLVTDAQLLSQYSDLTIYLVRQGFTFKNQLSIPEEIYRNSKMKKISLLINDIKMNSGYGYSYGYGYGYSYGDYLQEQKSKKVWQIWK